jgi:PAS domain S-box-containing protein
MLYKYSYANIPVIVLLIDYERHVVDCNKKARDYIGSVVGKNIEGVIDPEALAIIDHIIVSGRFGDPMKSAAITILSEGGEKKRIHGCLELISGPQLSPLIRMTALCDTEGLRVFDEAVYSAKLLQGLAQTTTEAMWCIEFLEPVDLTAGTDETIRQIFENDCRWVMCNEAMGRLYNVPLGMDFNDQPVSMTFPKSPENEIFVRQIIESGFSIDNAPSIDLGHDGNMVYVENTVRSDIENDYLLRLWGTVRDLTSYRQAQNRLKQQILEVGSILAAIPGGVVVIDRNRRVLALNPAVEELLSWKADKLLGRDIQEIMDIEGSLPDGRRWYGCDRQRWHVEIRTGNGDSNLFDAQIAPVGNDSPAERFVITLRPALLAADA